MLFLSRLLQVIFVLLLLRLVLRGIAALVRASRAPAAPDRPRREPLGSTELIRDRVCNTFLPRERALRAMVAGQEEHFCSTACRDKALAAVSQAS